MVDAVFWMTHGHRPQQAALLAVKRSFGSRVCTVGSRTDGRRDMVPADIVLGEPAEDDAFVDMVVQRAEAFGSGGGRLPVILLAMSRRRELISNTERLREAGVVLLAGAAETATIDLCEDKHRFAAFMKAAFPEHAVPTRLASDAAGLEAAVAEFEESGAETCVKPPVGIFGRGFWRLSRDTPVSAMFTGNAGFEGQRKVSHALFRMAYAADPRPVIVMPFLAGTEISIDALFREGELVRAATRRKRGSFQAVAEDSEQVLPVLRPMGRQLRLNGVVNVQVRSETDAAPGPNKVLEINTRYSGGSAYLVDAGIDLFSEAVSSVLGEDAPRPPVVPLLDVAVRAEAARPEAEWGDPA